MSFFSYSPTDRQAMRKYPNFRPHSHLHCQITLHLQRDYTPFTDSMRSFCDNTALLTSCPYFTFLTEPFANLATKALVLVGQLLVQLRLFHLSCPL